ncbi:Caseinolytic peptidase B protein like protein [Argiope bruennichi]|uniref:Caseinolytic peptidase B protein like protein n=1 Tax=Argiope bruennichi TaxID=94029 RepID=A0A8T0FNB5_ARGBR|nr:Caseinolytic peptidase B protein like protein [Argiope bruennichi]
MWEVGEKEQENFRITIFWSAREEEFNERLNTRATFQTVTALHYAVLADEPQIVEVLLKNGANPTIRNDMGHTPIDYAKENSRISKLLQTYTSKIMIERRVTM